jgi:twitching motility two-component system response regulator PilG
MRGSLHEIDIREILSLLERGQKTGELVIETDDSTGTRSWCFQFAGGRIAHATRRDDAPLARLADYLYPGGISLSRDPEPESDRPGIFPAEYTYLCRAIAEHPIGRERVGEILTAMIRETLFDVYPLGRGEFIFNATATSALLPFTLSVSPTVIDIARQAQQWRRFYPYIERSDRAIVIVRPDELETVLPERAYRNLTEWAERKITPRQLSRYLRRDVVTIARPLYPYVQRGWIAMATVDPEPGSVRAPSR